MDDYDSEADTEYDEFYSENESTLISASELQQCEELEQLQADLPEIDLPYTARTDERPLNDPELDVCAKRYETSQHF